MHVSRGTRTRALIVAITVLALGLVAAPASGKPLVQEHFESSFTETVEECGLTVDFSVDDHGLFQITTRGPGSPAYFHVTAHGSVTWTNPANGKTFTHVFNSVNKDLHITDNGDGTITVIAFGAGSDKYYANGELVLRNPGQTRVEILVDLNGTPEFFDDDIVLDEQIILGSTGRNDTEGLDFCADMLLPAIG